MTHFEEYRKIRDRLAIMAMGFAEDLMIKAEAEPDKVRDVIGSFQFRKLEEYTALNRQANAEFEEWVHEHLADKTTPF